MDNLEHNIKNAFSEADGKVKFEGKDGMWNRLENHMVVKNGVAAIWRVAAVFLGLIMTLGVFAAFNANSKYRAEIKSVTMENKRKQTIIDSLLTIPSTIQTQIQIVEKEKVVYRNIIVEQKRKNTDTNWQEEYQNLNDSTQKILLRNEQTFTQEIEKLNHELLSLKFELSQSQQKIDSSLIKNQNPPFELKSERVSGGLKASPSVKTTEMELKIFQRNFNGNKNDLNTTIFKK